MTEGTGVLWRRRPAGVFALCGDHKNRRQDAGATKICLPSWFS